MMTLCSPASVVEATERSFTGSRDGEPSESDAVLTGPAPELVAGTLLYLSWLRSTGIVMRALADRFPDSESWEAQLADPTLHEEIVALDHVVKDVGALVNLGSKIDLEVLEQAGAAHLDRGIDAVSLTAERLGVTPDDLLVVLIRR